MEVGENKRAPAEDRDIDAPMSVSGNWGQPPMDVVGLSRGPRLRRDQRYRADALRTALVADKEEVRGHARRRSPELKSRVGPTQFSLAEGVDAAISA